MKKFSLLLVMVTVLISCSDDTVIGSGSITSEMRAVDYFTKVKSEGVFKVNIIQDATQSVEIIANNNVINKVNTKVVGNELRLSLDKGNYKNVSLEVNISAERINGLNNSGSGNIYVYNVDEVGEFKINNSGSADILVEGSAASLDIKNEGSGSIMGFNFSVNNSVVDIEGSGDVKVSCSNTLKVEIDGSGSVYYKGNPTIDLDISGSGEVINDN